MTKNQGVNLVLIPCSRHMDMGGDSLAINPHQPSVGNRWCLEKPEDSNKRNIGQTGGMGTHIPVTITSPPGETTLIPS